MPEMVTGRAGESKGRKHAVFPSCVVSRMLRWSFWPPAGRSAPAPSVCYNASMEKTNQIRIDALAQLKKAQLMIEAGRRNLSAANEEIRVAQELIDQSADALRGMPPSSSGDR